MQRQSATPSLLEPQTRLQKIVWALGYTVALATTLVHHDIRGKPLDELIGRAKDLLRLLDIEVNRTPSGSPGLREFRALMTSELFRISTPLTGSRTLH
jgi:hypothetical protein